MDDKRKFPRRNTEPIKVLWRKEGGFDNLDDILNISGGGVCIVMKDKNAQTGEIVQLTFKLDQGEVIHLRGKVVWVKKGRAIKGEEICFSAGIEFIDMYDKDREGIKQFVKEFSDFSTDKENQS